MSIASEIIKEKGRTIEGLKKKCRSLKQAAEALVEFEEIAGKKHIQ